MKLISEIRNLPKKYALGVTSFVVGTANSAAVVMLSLPFYLQNPYFYCNSVRVSQNNYCNCVGERLIESSSFTSMSKLYQLFCVSEQAKFETTLVTIKNISQLVGYLLSMVVGFSSLNYLRLSFSLTILGVVFMVISWNQPTVIAGYSMAQFGYAFLQGRGCKQFVKLFQRHAMDGLSICYGGWAFFCLFACLAYSVTDHFKTMTVIAAAPGLIGLAYWFLSEEDLKLELETKDQAQETVAEVEDSWLRLAKHMLFYVMTYLTYSLLILFMNTLLWGSIVVNVAAVTAAELLVNLIVIYFVMGTEHAGDILSLFYLASGLLLVVAEFTGKFTIGVFFVLKIAIDFQWLLQAVIAKQELSQTFLGHYFSGRQFLASVSLMFLPFYKQFMQGNGFQGYLPIGIVILTLTILTYRR